MIKALMQRMILISRVPMDFMQNTMYNEHVNCFTKKVIEVSNISCTFIIIDYTLFFNIDVSFNKHMHVS